MENISIMQIGNLTPTQVADAVFDYDTDPAVADIDIRSTGLTVYFKSSEIRDASVSLAQEKYRRPVTIEVGEEYIEGLDEFVTA
jgi:hypothetical protein